MTNPAPTVPSDSAPKRPRRRAFDWSTAAIATVALAAAAAIYVRDGREHFLAIFGSDLFGEMLPKVLAGCLIGAFVTMILPRELVVRWVGHESGFTGLLIAAFFGFLLPGGPMVGFAIGAVALKSGAGAPQVIAYSTAWALYAIHRLVVWEVPLMPARVVWLRAAVSLPLPFIAAGMAMLLAQP